MTAANQSGQPPPDPTVIQVSQELGITHAEFFRSLAEAIAGKAYVARRDQVKITEGEQCIVITLTPEGKRILGRLQLPTTLVTFSFAGYSLSEVEKFMTQFNNHFQRGGG